MTPTNPNYWAQNWPETVKGITIHRSLYTEEVTKELAELATNQPQLDPDEIINRYTAN